MTAARSKTTKAAKKTVRKKTAKKAKRRKRKKALPVSAQRVRAAGLKFESIVAAAGAIECEPDLEECLATYPVLAASWERGQFLRRIQRYAESGATVSHIARKIGMEPTALRDLIKTDGVVRDIWEEATIAVDMTIQAGYLKAVANGDISATGINRIERLFRDRTEGQPGPPVGTDIARVPQKDLTALFGVSRQALHEWYVSKGLPRNADGSYNLRDVLPWYRKYLEDKLLTAGPKTTLPGGLNRMQLAKGRKVELEVGELEGRLWRREEVIEHWIAATQFIVNTLSRQTAVELGHRLAGRTDEEVTMELGKVFRKLRRALAEPPATVTIDPAVADLYQQIVTALAEAGGADSSEATHPGHADNPTFLVGAGPRARPERE